MGDKYEISGQAGAVGPNAHAHDMTFNQTVTPAEQNVDFAELTRQLAEMRHEIMRRMDASPEASIALGRVTEAERAAGVQDVGGAVEHLKAAGNWALDFAKDSGKDLVVKVVTYYSCFISYSHADKAFARRLHDQLQARGIRCWLDEHQLVPGQDIYDEVDRGIRLWDKVLLCCSNDSLSSWWVDKEISTAFDKEQQLWKARGEKSLALIPLNLDGYMFTDAWQDGKAIPIKSRLAADFSGWDGDDEKFEREFERLVKALRADGGDREAPPESKL